MFQAIYKKKLKGTEICSQIVAEPPQKPLVTFGGNYSNDPADVSERLDSEKVQPND